MCKPNKQMLIVFTSMSPEQFEVEASPQFTILYQYPIITISFNIDDITSLNHIHKHKLYLQIK